MVPYALVLWATSVHRDQFKKDSLGQGWAVVKEEKTVNGRRTYTMEAKNSHVVGFKIYDSRVISCTLRILRHSLFLRR